MADVCRADKRLIEVYAFDQTIGSENFERVPFWCNDRRIVADTHNDESGCGRNRARIRSISACSPMSSTVFTLHIQRAVPESP